MCQGSVASHVSVVRQFKFPSFYVLREEIKENVAGLLLKSQQEADMNKHKHTPTLQFHAP